MAKKQHNKHFGKLGDRSGRRRKISRRPAFSCDVAKDATPNGGNPKDSHVYSTIHQHVRTWRAASLQRQDTATARYRDIHSTLLGSYFSGHGGCYKHATRRVVGFAGILFLICVNPRLNLRHLRAIT
ncbi:MAG: hypothetical protein LBT83_09105 [Tannerella sp.]|nr:hypothetical protein [Tannerella sp.]